MSMFLRVQHYLSILIYSIFSFMCRFCRSLFVLFRFSFGHCVDLFFFDLRLRITPLLSSSSFYLFQDFYLVERCAMIILGASAILTHITMQMVIYQNHQIIYRHSFYYIPDKIPTRRNYLTHMTILL